MGKLYYVILLLGIFSCNKKDNDKSTSTDNYVNCKVNGATWQSKTGEFLTTSRSARIEDSGRVFVLDATHKDNSSQIAVRAYSAAGIKSGTYQLTGTGMTSGMYNINSVYYRTDSTNNKGVLTIVISDGRASGTFSFKAVNTNTSEVVNITDGAFSLPL